VQVAYLKLVKHEAKGPLERFPRNFQHCIVGNQPVNNRQFGPRLGPASNMLPVRPRAFSPNQAHVMMQQSEQIATNAQALNRDQGHARAGFLKDNTFRHASGREVLVMERLEGYDGRGCLAEFAPHR
jgi:recombinational DNA repair protein (RecF pathway)